MFELKPNPQLILASASPRRAELLKQIGVEFTQCSANIVEQTMQGELADDFVLRMAKEKAQAALQQLQQSSNSELSEFWVLASDTVIELQGEILGKPVDFEHATQMWRKMSGNKHRVLSSLCLISERRSLALVSSNLVEFSEISDSQMQAYWQSGEPQDKAGAYAIQGKAALWIRHIQGSYSSIMGLPAFETGKLLESAGFELWP